MMHSFVQIINYLIRFYWKVFVIKKYFTDECPAQKLNTESSKTQAKTN